MLAVVAGWLIAGRVARADQADDAAAATPSPTSGSTSASRSGGRGDELRELGETLDAMLDRLAGRRSTPSGGSWPTPRHELRSPLTVIRTETEVTLADPDATAEDFRGDGADRARGDRPHRGAARRADGARALPARPAALRPRRPVPRRAPRRSGGDGDGAGRRACGSRSTPTATATVPGDESLLERLVANLVDNAVRYNEPGGWVVVRAGGPTAGPRRRGRELRRAVPPEDVERLTQPFERLDRGARVAAARASASRSCGRSRRRTAGGSPSRRAPTAACVCASASRRS